MRDDVTGTLWSPDGVGLVLSTFQSGSAVPATCAPVRPIRASAAPAVEAAAEMVPRLTVWLTPLGSTTVTCGSVSPVDDVPVFGVGAGEPLAPAATATRPPTIPMDTIRRTAWFRSVTRPRIVSPRTSSYFGRHRRWSRWLEWHSAQCQRLALVRPYLSRTTLRRVRQLVLKVTVGADAPERCAQAFTVAATAVASGVDVSLWLTGEASWFALPGRAESFERA